MAVEHEAFREQLIALLADLSGLDQAIPRPRVTVDAPPPAHRTVTLGGAISETQAMLLQQLVRDVNAKHHAPYQTIWALVNQHSGVTSYRLTPAENFDAAAFYLQHWIDTGLPPA